MVVPGEPELAADLAKRAASVSHDGEAIFGAQVIAAMEAQAFVENCTVSGRFEVQLSVNLNVGMGYQSCRTCRSYMLK